ncbi:MAG: WD40 repeat domain-containing protein [bacterium]
MLSCLKSHYQVVNTVSWSPSLNMLVSGSDDTSVKLWATKERKLEAGPAKSALVKSL